MSTPEEIDRAARIDELTKQAAHFRRQAEGLEVGSGFAPGMFWAARELEHTIAHYQAGGPVDVGSPS